MKLKKIISTITSVAILTTSIPIIGFAEGSNTPVPNSDRWTFRQAYMDMPRVLNTDGTYTFPKFGLTDKQEVYTFIQNLLDLNTLPDGSGVDGYPGQLTFFKQPMMLDVPKDLINTVKPEDIELYTTLSNAGSGFKAKLNDEQLDRLYMRDNTWVNGKDKDINLYRNGDKENPISIPNLTEYSAKTFDVSEPVLYDKNHNIVPKGQSGGAYFKFMISGAAETNNPGTKNKDYEDKGYGLRIDERKSEELTDALRGFIDAGMFKNPIEYTGGVITSAPSDPFTMEYFKFHFRNSIESIPDSRGLFNEMKLNIDKADAIIYSMAYNLAEQFINIDAVKAQENTPKLATEYQLLGNIQSTWATSKEGLVPYIEEVLLREDTLVEEAYNDKVKGLALDMILQSANNPTVGFPNFHELMTGLSGGSYIKMKLDSNGNQITDSNGKTIMEREPITNGPVYADNFTEAFSNIKKSGGLETSIYTAFLPELTSLYSILNGLPNDQIETTIQAWFDSLLANNNASLTNILNNMRYISKLAAVPLPESYRTYYPIAIRLKVADELNLAATNLTVNPNGCVDWKAEMLEGSGDIVTNGEIRAYDKMTGDVVERAKLSGITFSSTNKVATGQVCMDPNIDYVYEFEINPDPRTHTEKTYDDNIFAKPPLDIEASSLTCIPSADEKTLEVHWLANLVGEYTGVTSVEMLIKNPKDGTVLAHDTIPNLTFNDEGYISGDYTFNVGNSIPPQSVNIIFRVNLPGGNPGNQPNNEVNYTNNDLTISTIIGTIPPLPDITAKCETMSDKEGSERIITKVERRSWDDLDSGNVTGWSTKTYRANSCPTQEYKKTWYLDGSLSKQTQDHAKYVKCVRRCGSYSRKGKCRDVYYEVTERVSAVVEFKVKVTGHTPILWNNRFIDRDWIRAGYGVNIGGKIWLKTDYDKPLNPIIATYRPKDNVSNINVDLLPEHDSDTFSVDTTNNGGLKIIDSSGSPASGNYFFQYQSTSRPLYDTGGDQHGATNQRYINVQRADGPYTVWYLVVFPEFSGRAGDGNQYVLGSCRSKSIRVEGTMYDDYYVHPADEGDQPN